jgi:thioredoxin 2
VSHSTLRVCSRCGVPNRVSAKHLPDTGRCGACKADLPPSSEPIDVDSSTFDEITRQVTVPILVDFWAEWCPPCRAAAPEVHALAEEMAGKALVLKVDTEKSPDLASRFRVQSIPNFVVLRDGNVVLQQPGLVGRQQMKRWLERA